MKYISEQELNQVHGGAQTAPADPARTKPGSAGDNDTTHLLNDAAVAQSDANPVVAPVDKSTASQAPHAPSVDASAADADKHDDTYHVSTNVIPNAVALPREGSTDHSQNVTPSDDAAHATDVPHAPSVYIDPAGQNADSGKNYAALKVKTVAALESAKLILENEVDAYLSKLAVPNAPESEHGSTPGTSTIGTAHGTQNGESAANDISSDWMMVISPQEVTESQYRTLESAHKVVDSIKALQGNMLELQFDDAMRNLHVDGDDSRTHSASEAQPVGGGHGTSDVVPSHGTSAVEPADGQTRDEFAKALVAQKLALVSKLDHLISQLDTDATDEESEGGSREAGHTTSLGQTSPAQGSEDEWTIVEHPFAIPESEYQANTAAHEDLRKTSALTLSALEAQIDSALYDISANIDDSESHVEAEAAARSASDADGGGHAPPAIHDEIGKTPDANPHTADDDAPVEFTDEDSHHVVEHLLPGTDADPDAAYMDLLKSKLENLDSGKTAIPYLAIDKDAKDSPDTGDDAMEAQLRKELADDSELMGPSDGKGDDWTTVIETPYPAAQDASGHDPAHDDAKGGDGSVDLVVKDMTHTGEHSTPATPAPDPTFDSNVKTAAQVPAIKVQEQRLTPAEEEEEENSLTLTNGETLDLTEEVTPSSHSTPGEEHAHAAGEDASHPASAGTEHGAGAPDSTAKPHTGQKAIDEAYNLIDQRQSTIRTGDQIGHVTDSLPDGEKTGGHAGASTDSTHNVIINADGIAVRADVIAQGEAGGTLKKGPLTLEGDAKANAHASGEVHVGKDGIDIKGQAGGDASVSGGVAISGKLGKNVTGTVGVEDTAEAHAAVAGRIGTKGIEAAAAAGVTNTTAVGAGVTGDLGKNVTMTGEIHSGLVEQATAGAHTGLSDKGINEGVGAVTGVYSSTGASLTVGDDHYKGTIGADLHSEGAIGFSEDASANFSDGNVTFNIAGDIDLGIGGLAFHIGATIDIKGIEHKAEHVIEDAAKHLAHVMSNTAHEVEHALVKAGHTVAEAAKTAAHAVASWFKKW